jgi:hypothetical protein
MPTYYVATMARYVLVEANDETQARERGRSALNEQHPSTEILTVRSAKPDEIELSEWHQQFAAS